MLHLVRGGRRQLASAFICRACRQHSNSNHPRRFATTRINGVQANTSDTNAALSVDEAAVTDAPIAKAKRSKTKKKEDVVVAKLKAEGSPAPEPTDTGTEVGEEEEEPGAPAAEEATASAPTEVPEAKKKRGRKPKSLKSTEPEEGKGTEERKETEEGEGAAEPRDTFEADDDAPDSKPTQVFENGNYEEVNASSITPGYVKAPRWPKVPCLQYGLDRALFNPGPYLLQDDRSKVYNFDPYLSRIMPAEEFDFEALKKYITSSKDETLISMARDHKCKYTGSTSSMTSVLAHFHYLLSAWRPINTASLSQGFDAFSHNFTLINRAPAATFLHYRDGVYAIDADKEFDNGTILSMLGKSMEKLLTVPKEKFEQYRKCNSGALTDEERNRPEAYNYTSMGDFMMRSQLDAFHSRLPTARFFDLKTRAVVTIRMDARNPQKGNTYELVKRHGNWQSYEREYYDMMRAAFLKYSLQVRMGRMDGIFVAYHNTKRIFGFQYIPLEEMDNAIHGTDYRMLGHAEFRLSIHLLNKALDKITERFPKQTLRLYFETKSTTKVPSLYIFARPVSPGEVEAVQEAAEARVAGFERTIMGQGQPSTQTEEGRPQTTKKKRRGSLDEESTEIATKVWEDMLEQVQQLIRDGDQGAIGTRDVIEMALQGTGLLETDEASEVERYINAVAETFAFDENPDTTDPPLDESVTSDLPSEGALDPQLKMFFDQLTSARHILDEPTPHFRKLQEAIKGMITDNENMKYDEETGKGIEDADIPLAEDAAEKEGTEEPVDNEDVFGIVLTIQNEIRGKPVLRPDRIDNSNDWTVKYHMKELSPAMARSAFKVVVRRRERIFSRSSKGDAYRNPFFGRMLRRYADLGRVRRQAEEARAKREPVHVYGWKPIPYNEAFDPKSEPTPRKTAAKATRQHFSKAKQAARGSAVNSLRNKGSESESRWNQVGHLRGQLRSDTDTTFDLTDQDASKPPQKLLSPLGKLPFRKTVPAEEKFQQSSTLKPPSELNGGDVGLSDLNTSMQTMMKQLQTLQETLDRGLVLRPYAKTEAPRKETEKPKKKEGEFIMKKWRVGVSEEKPRVAVKEGEKVVQANMAEKTTKEEDSKEATKAPAEEEVREAKVEDTLEPKKEGAKEVNITEPIKGNAWFKEAEKKPKFGGWWPF